MRVVLLAGILLTSCSVQSQSSSGDLGQEEVTASSAGLTSGGLDGADTLMPKLSDTAQWRRGRQVQLHVRPVEPKQALEELRARAVAEQRMAVMANSVRAVRGSLAPVGPGETCPQVMVRFLDQYGSLLFDKPPTAAIEPIHLRVLKQPMHYRRGKQQGEIIIFQQGIDEFEVLDNMVSGRCVKGVGLAAVWGRLWDPADSPARASLAVQTQKQAERAYTTRFADKVSSAELYPARILQMRQHKAVWLFGNERLDAVTGEWLKPIPPPVHDPIVLKGGEK